MVRLVMLICVMLVGDFDEFMFCFLVGFGFVR